jgi:hypothetical protein
MKEIKEQKLRYFLLVNLPHFLFYILIFIRFRNVSGGDIAFVIVWLFSYLIYFLIWFFLILFLVNDFSIKKRIFINLLFLIVIEVILFKILG